ncbi:MAG: hypothetical protein MUF87_17295 [Anaerolineae bacterium]|jgi:hypothetical protein|nr:hypothetical protein [Anaerolineae bacterium]
MNQPQALYQLQQIDLQLLKRQKQLEEIALKLDDNSAIQAAQASVDVATATLTPLRAKARNLELESQSTQTKSKDTEQHLYSGNVKNPKTMQELQQEIASLKKRQQELDDHLLEVLLEVEEAQNALDHAQKTLDEVKERSESDYRDLLIGKADLQAQIEVLGQDRLNALKPITPESLKLYNALRGRKANQPMSLLNGLSCSLCGIEQTMNVVQEARHGHKLVPCINCGRILVYK